jgi:hypothetical protein
VASFKKPVSTRGYPQTTTDIFSSPNRDSGRANYMKFVDIGISLVENAYETWTYGETFETDPKIYRIDFSLSKGDNQGYVGVNPNGDKRYTLLNLSLAMAPK